MSSRPLRAIKLDPLRAQTEARLGEGARRAALSLGADLPEPEPASQAAESVTEVEGVAARPLATTKPARAKRPAKPSPPEPVAEPSASALRKVGTLAEPYTRGDNRSTVRISVSIFVEADRGIRHHIATYPYVSKNDFISLAILEKLERFEKEKALGYAPAQPLRRATRARNHERKDA